MCVLVIGREPGRHGSIPPSFYKRTSSLPVLYSSLFFSSSLALSLSLSLPSLSLSLSLHLTHSPSPHMLSVFIRPSCSFSPQFSFSSLLLSLFLCSALCSLPPPPPSHISISPFSPFPLSLTPLTCLLTVIPPLPFLCHFLFSFTCSLSLSLSFSQSLPPICQEAVRKGLFFSSRQRKIHIEVSLMAPVLCMVFMDACRRDWWTLQTHSPSAPVHDHVEDASTAYGLKASYLSGRRCGVKTTACPCVIRLNNFTPRESNMQITKIV